jgi:hypothetical protein
MTITNITGTRTKLAGDKFKANTLIQNQKAESTDPAHFVDPASSSPAPPDSTRWSTT